MFDVQRSERLREKIRRVQSLPLELENTRWRKSGHDGKKYLELITNVIKFHRHQFRWWILLVPIILILCWQLVKCTITLEEKNRVVRKLTRRTERQAERQATIINDLEVLSQIQHRILANSIEDMELVIAAQRRTIAYQATRITNLETAVLRNN